MLDEAGFYVVSVMSVILLLLLLPLQLMLTPAVRVTETARYGIESDRADVCIGIEISE